MLDFKFFLLPSPFHPQSPIPYGEGKGRGMEGGWTIF